MHRRVFTAAAASLLARPALGQARARVLKFVPQSNLASPDPVWTTATIATIHGHMVWDSLYGVGHQADPEAADGGAGRGLR